MGRKSREDTPLCDEDDAPVGTVQDFWQPRALLLKNEECNAVTPTPHVLGAEQIVNVHDTQRASLDPAGSDFSAPSQRISLLLSWFQRWKEKRIILGAIAMGVVVVGIVIILGVMPYFVPRTLPLSTPLSPPALEQLIIAQAVEATCGNGSTAPYNAFNASIHGEPWICVMPYGLPGEKLTITLPKEYVITAIALRVDNGFQSARTLVRNPAGKASGHKRVARHGTVAEIQWYFDDHSRVIDTSMVEPHARKTGQSRLQIDHLVTRQIIGIFTHIIPAPHARVPDFLVTQIKIYGYPTGNR